MTNDENFPAPDAKAVSRTFAWFVRAGLAAGVLASVFANAMHAQPSFVGRAIAAWAPLAFFAVVEFLSRMPSGRSFATRVRFAAAAVVGGVAAWISYWHMVAVAARYGEQYAHFLPLSVDGLIVVTSMCLFELKRRPRKLGAAKEPTTLSPVERQPEPAKPQPPTPSVGVPSTPVRVKTRRASRPIRGEVDREDVARRIVAGETSAGAVATEIGKTPQAVRGWVRDYRAKHLTVPELTAGVFTQAEPEPINGHEFTPGAADEAQVN